MKKSELKKFKTYELVEELSKREGVEKIYIEPYQEIKVKIEGPMITRDRTCGTYGNIAQFGRAYTLEV